MEMIIQEYSGSGACPGSEDKKRGLSLLVKVSER